MRLTARYRLIEGNSVPWAPETTVPGSGASDWVENAPIGFPCGPRDLFVGASLNKVFLHFPNEGHRRRRCGHVAAQDILEGHHATIELLRRTVILSHLGATYIDSGEQTFGAGITQDLRVQFP